MLLFKYKHYYLVRYNPVYYYSSMIQSMQDKISPIPPSSGQRVAQDSRDPHSSLHTSLSGTFPASRCALYDSVAILGHINPFNHCNGSHFRGLGIQAGITGSGDLVTKFVMCSEKRAERQEKNREKEEGRKGVKDKKVDSSVVIGHQFTLCMTPLSRLNV